MRLTDEELRDILARAEEIQRTSHRGAETDAEMRAVIYAAQEVGLERHAVERALRERFEMPLEPPEAGELVFAKSADDKYYTARVLSSSTDAVRVRYLRGSEATLALDELRPCSFRPGEEVMVDWPWWGAWRCTVTSYYADAQRVELDDGWGYEKTFDIADVWIEPRRKSARTGAGRYRIFMAIAGGSGIGALIGSALTYLLLR